MTALSSSFSVLLRKDGELLYIPSWNLWPVLDDAYWAAAPHEESATAAIISSIELFFMFKSPIIYNNFVSSQLVMSCNRHAPNSDV